MSMVRKAIVAAGGATLTVVALAQGASAQTTTSSGGANWGVVFVIGVAFAVACGLVAKNKNRSVALWAVLGFLFGFIPLIIIAVLKKKAPEMYDGMGGSSMTPPPPPPPTP